MKRETLEINGDLKPRISCLEAELNQQDGNDLSNIQKEQSAQNQESSSDESDSGSDSDSDSDTDDENENEGHTKPLKRYFNESENGQK